MLSEEEGKRAEYIEQGISPFHLAAGMLWEDRLVALALIVIFSLPEMLWVVGDTASSSKRLIVELLERVLELGSMAWLVKRWIIKLGGSTFQIASSSLKLLFLLGLLFVLVRPIPAANLLSLDPPLGYLSGFILGGIGFVGYQYFFYFFCVMTTAGGYKERLTHAAEMLKLAPAAPLFCIFVPLGLSSLITALFMLPSPEGRLIFPMILGSFGNGIYWAITLYLSLAYALSLVSPPLWRELELDPYRWDRFKTICKIAPHQLKLSFQRSSAFAYLGLGIALWIGAIVFASTHPPDFEIEVVNATAKGKNALISLKLSDQAHRFRGIRMDQFWLGSPDGQFVSVELNSVTDIETGEPAEIQFDQTRENRSVKLNFKTERKARHLVSLKDLNLWYRRYKVTGLKLQLEGAAEESSVPAEVAADAEGR